MAEASFALPVYLNNNPEKPYQVIGMVRYKSPFGQSRTYWRDKIIERFVEKTLEISADALIIPTVQPNPRSEMIGYVIQWIPSAIVEAQKQAKLKFWKDFEEKNGKLMQNRELFECGIKYLETKGIKPCSEDMAKQLADLLGQITTQDKSRWTGPWLVKGHIQNKRLVSAQTETFVTLAQITEAGKKYVFITQGARCELNFNGTIEPGQIKGTLGIGAKDFSVTTEITGVVVNDKISITLRQLTEAGVVEGNLTLLR